MEWNNCCIFISRLRIMKRGKYALFGPLTGGHSCRVQMMCQVSRELEMDQFTSINIRRKEAHKRFMDSLRIYARGGVGGNGFRRMGGIGGRGGGVYIVADTDMTLKKLKDKYPEKRFIARNGVSAQPHVLQGFPGEDMIVGVPKGITVVTDDNVILGDVNEAGDKLLVAAGGVGGSQVNNFVGQKGERRSIKLDLKLLADVGFVGFPNAGKSTLLNAVSKAKPKIASYPFTTLHPNVGVMEFDDFRQISMADLPGLIEGAHINIGMGHKFLKHVERTKLLLYVVDIQGFQFNVNFPLRTPFETIILLNKELELYKRELLGKPAILCVNKMDTNNAVDKLKELVKMLESAEDHMHLIDEPMRPKHVQNFQDVIAISAMVGTNTGYFKRRIREIIDLHAESQLSHLHKKIYDNMNSSLQVV